jgi:hypothetical protein
MRCYLRVIRETESDSNPLSYWYDSRNYPVIRLKWLSKTTENSYECTGNDLNLGFLKYISINMVTGTLLKEYSAMELHRIGEGVQLIDFFNFTFL